VAPPTSDFTVSIDWGDQTPPTPGDLTAGNTMFNVHHWHQYAEEGTYTIHTTITTLSGAATTFVSTAVVTPAMMLAAGAPQAPALPTAQLQEMDFTGRMGEEAVTSDDGKTTYTQPKWLSGGADVQDPVAIVRGNQLTLSALTFVVSDAAAFRGIVTAVGTVSGLGIPRGTTITTSVGFTAGETKTLVIVDRTGLALSNNVLDKVTEGVLTISWALVLANGQNISAGASKNRFYVPYALPNVPAAFAPKPLYETVLKTGCLYNDGAADTQDTVFIHAFRPFRNLKVPRAGRLATDPNLYLKYYGDWTTTSKQTDTLLKSGDGNCVAWSKFFIDVLEAQGIHQTGWNYPVIATTDLGFKKPDMNGNLMEATAPTNILVKKWTWTTAAPIFTSPKLPENGVLGGKQFYLNKYVVPGPLANSYNWTQSQVQQALNDPLNFPGQGQPTPQSMFNKHNVVLFDGKLYDPSYGRVWANLDDFRKNALAGFAYDFRGYPLDANNQFDPIKGTPQNIVLFYPPGTDVPGVTLSRPTSGPLAEFNDY
jgi:hypothetical protein